MLPRDWQLFSWQRRLKRNDSLCESTGSCLLASLIWLGKAPPHSQDAQEASDDLFLSEVPEGALKFPGAPATKKGSPFSDGNRKGSHWTFALCAVAGFRPLLFRFPESFAESEECPLDKSSQGFLHFPLEPANVAVSMETTSKLLRGKSNDRASRWT